MCIHDSEETGVWGTRKTDNFLQNIKLIQAESVLAKSEYLKNERWCRSYSLEEIYLRELEEHKHEYG